jgi:hypothetical protein
MRAPWRNLATTDVPVVNHDRPNAASEKAVEAGQVPASVSASVSENASEEFTPGAQQGVLRIEATTTVWTQRDLIIAYIL